ncbi:fibulin-2-like isoform X1 [Myxocyprinus asiaticus]|uniref:fibulin-2-like isoform X1 n=1 Tax=Myxocyprinus asiaticus TaxID=70543 RepID=UPI002223ED4E|nr:fibulin-2-like isoform X1 [Myxocyprinus asiaticus]XP_051528729.1 fibulin-2-like isoform X1 [Myxocyprinus asiaticus]
MASGLLNLVLLLSISGCLCQRDCTGVNCPVLNNCIEEVLDTGACCATCVQTGCMCEGYQYYDCISAGFRNGKVPEGESYFVDFGSTECSCPQGGGRIRCHFIPCPEIPANCIQLTEPADGCIQCERVGCVHEEQKYEAGHSFQIDPCQVCHCPNDGGNLMCYPIPNCDPSSVLKPMLETTTEESTPERRYRDPIQHIFNHQGSRGAFTKHLPALHSDGNRSLKLRPSQVGEEVEDVEDYDYPPTDSLDPSLRDFAFPTESSITLTPHQAFHRGAKQELREMFGFRKSTTDRPELPFHKDDTDRMKIGIHKDKPNKELFSPLKFKTDLEQFIHPVETTNRVGFSNHKDATETQSFSLYKDNLSQEALTDMDSNIDNELLAYPTETTDGDIVYSLEDTTYSEVATDSPMTVEETTASWHTAWNSVSKSSINILLPNTVETDSSKQEESTSKDEVAILNETASDDGIPPIDVDENESLLSSPGPVEQSVTVSGIDPSETLPTPLEDHREPSVDHKQHHVEHRKPAAEHVQSFEENNTKLDGKHEWQLLSTVKFSPTSPPPNKQSHSLFNFREEEEADNTLGSHSRMEEAPGLVESCCVAGQKWAEEKQHCNHMPVKTKDLSSVCGVVQKQCCTGALRESRCQAGMNAAKAGLVCEGGNSTLCEEDSQRDCCSCCALGLRLHKEGKGCEAHQYLSYPCGHVFLTCCEEEEGLTSPTLKKKDRPQPTTLPKRVSDSQFPKQALSVGDVDHAANSLEDLEHDDRCQRSPSLCHHTCINTRDSYMCGCHPGYTLLQDAHTCVADNQEEDNRVSEEDRLTSITPARQETTTQIPVLRNPCAGNGLCSQQCSVIRGLAQCSCFPGYSLMANGHTCEDVNECTGGRHNCSLEEVCVNREGSYQCVPLNEMCDEGFIHNQNRDCVDVNECLTDTHTCQTDEQCVNTVGAFMCERKISCPSGYQQRNGVCEDIDECVMRTHNCGIDLQCQNTDGSFKCNLKQRCLTGFTQDLQGNCIDIDECSSVREPCTAGFNCINTVGSYTCQRKIIICSQGYHSSPDGARCIDVDECQTGTHRCGQGQICHNLPGSYRCDCQTGYQYDAIRQLCVDVNECWRYPGRLCAQTCENTAGSYQCSCTTGFSLAFDGKNCEDLNECDNNPCSQECANIYGSYQCYCRMGYFLKEDGHTCEDIDECSQSIGNLCAFQCVNVPGSYKCACPAHGYSISTNGRTCQDIDECAIGTHNCSASQTCFNIQGGFRCLSFTCPENYRRVSDIRCERIRCPNFQQCQTMPLRITYYQLSFQTNIVIPAQIFRIGPSPAYSGDNIIISIPHGNEEGYFSTRKLNSFTGAVYLHRQVREPRDFLIDVEMKLLRQGTFTTFLARIYVFITANSM